MTYLEPFPGQNPSAFEHHWIRRSRFGSRDKILGTRPFQLAPQQCGHLDLALYWTMHRYPEAKRRRWTRSHCRRSDESSRLVRLRACTHVWRCTSGRNGSRSSGPCIRLGSTLRCTPDRRLYSISHTVSVPRSPHTRRTFHHLHPRNFPTAAE